MRIATTWIPTVLALVAASCGDGGLDPARAFAGAASADEAADWPPTAKAELVQVLRENRATPRHPADGGGRAWIEPREDRPAVVPMRGRGSWTIVYEAGELGIVEGGLILVQASAYWGWSGPQSLAAQAPGYTLAATEAEGVELELMTFDEYRLGIRIGGRALRSGERVRIEYGAGPAGVRSDDFAERGEHVWIGVDGDGDGVHGILHASPTLTIGPREAARLWLTVPTTAVTGDEVELVVAALDAVANAVADVTGELVFVDVPAGVELPERVTFAAADHGRKRVRFRVAETGTVRLRAEMQLEDGFVLEGESNPLVVGATGPPIRWGDLHGHSNYSDGTGLPEDYFAYARDVAALDVVALTDHDHWGVVFLDENPALWDHLKAQANRFDQPDRFVTLVGYEWTSWIYGHRHVLYFTDDGGLHSSIDEATDHPEELWDALRGQPAMTIAHHSAGGPIAVDWSIAPDPELEPVTEVVSAHGVSEAPDAPRILHGPVRGNFVRDALDKGYRLGFVGSGDGHDGHPGLTGLNPMYPTGGLIAMIGGELTREGVLATIRSRRVYATSGARIYVRCALEGQPMGSRIPAVELGEEASMFLSVVGTSPIRYVDVIRRGTEVERLDVGGRDELALTYSFEGLAAGDYVYVRVIQDDRRAGGDGGMAWTSPFFIE